MRPNRDVTFTGSLSGVGRSTERRCPSAGALLRSLATIGAVGDVLACFDLCENCGDADGHERRNKRKPAGSIAPHPSVVVSGQRNSAAGKTPRLKAAHLETASGGTHMVHLTDAQRRSWRTLFQVGAASLVIAAVDGFLDPETRLAPLLIPFFAWGISYVQTTSRTAE